MKANPDAIVKFVSSQHHEMHAEDGSQWEDGQTQGDSQAEYIFPVDEQDEDYVQVEERRHRRRAEANRYDHEQEGGWLPEALKDLSDSDEMEGADEVRKEAREMKRARKKAEAEAKKREKEDARLKAQEEAAKRAEARGTTTKRHLKHFPLAGAPSSNQPAVGPSSTSPRRPPTHLDEV
jgi:membrane protein involved in colicin uptake